MDKHAIALVLDEIGTLLELHGENKFKVRAFQTAARAVEKLDEDIAGLAVRGKLEDVPGLGPATARIVRELVQTGTAKFYLDLRARTPSGFYELLAVPRLGATRIRKLHEALGINSVADLEQAARAGKIAQLPGFGGKTEELLLQGVAYVRGTLGRRRLAEALEVGPRLLGFVASLTGVERADIAGELRRRLETVAGIDIVAAVTDETLDDVVTTFLALPGVSESRREGQRAAAARLADGFLLRLHCARPNEYGSELLRQTGSEQHVQRLRARAAEKGVNFDALTAEDEEEVYARLGLPFVEPELRELGDEIEVAAKRELPELVTLEQLRGCFHCHTTYSDGRASVAEMGEAARRRGWRYLGIADHSKNASYAGGLSRDEIVRQHAEIDDWNAQHGKKVWLFKGIEADILNDGRLDYDDEPDVLASFDFVVGSVHSSFGLPEAEMTRRLIRAMQNPSLTFLGHMTGRLLLSRSGYRVDVAAVLNAARDLDVAVEINADPHRLDLDWRHWRAARGSGVRTAINPDAHSARSLAVVEYGVYMARKGWLAADDVVNSWKLPQVRAYLAKRKRL